MQRTSPIAEIFGYLVCLLTVVVFFVSVAGIVNSAFRVVNPTAGPRVFMERRLPGHAGNFFFRTSGPPPEAMPPSPGPDVTAMRAHFEGDARYDAVRRLVLAVVMLALSVVVFRRTFGWLNRS